MASGKPGRCAARLWKLHCAPAEAFERLLDHEPDASWRAYQLSGWWGGLRLSEARHLRWQETELFPWVDCEGNCIRLPAVFAKSGEDQFVPIHPQLRQTLAALVRTDEKVFPFRLTRDGSVLSRNGITSRVRYIAKKAGVKLSMHKLRKAFGSRAAKLLGKSAAPILHQLMRHSPMQITMDYYANVDDALQEAIERLT